MKSNLGFSVPQLLILIAIILIIATILIPNPHVGGKHFSNEVTAVANLRAINVAEVTYQSLKGRGSYGNVQDLIAEKLLAARFSDPIVSQYAYSLRGWGKNYIVTATPTSTVAGRFGYYTLSDAVVRYQTAPSATCDPCFPKGQAGLPVQ